MNIKDFKMEGDLPNVNTTALNIHNFSADPNQNNLNAAVLGHANADNQRLAQEEKSLSISGGPTGSIPIPSGNPSEVLGSTADTLKAAFNPKTYAVGLKSALSAPIDIVRGLFGKKPLKTNTDIQSIQSDFAENTVPAVERGEISPGAATAGAVLDTVGTGAAFLGGGEFTGLGKVGSGISLTSKGLQTSAKEAGSIFKGNIRAADSPLSQATDYAANKGKAVMNKMIGQKTSAEILATPQSQVYKLNPVERKYYYDKAGESVQAKGLKDEAKIKTDFEAKSAASQKEIETLNRDVQTLSRDEVLKLRPKIREAMGRQSEEYRRLIDEDFAPHANEKASAKDVREFIRSRFPDNPEMQQAIVDKLGVPDDFAKTSTFGDLMKKARSFREEIGSAAKKGTRVYSADEKMADDAISTLTDYMASKGVDLSRARSFWAKYAPVRNQLVSEAKPFLQTDTQTKTFANTLKRVAEGTDVNNENFIGHVEDLVGESVGADVKATLKKLGAAEKTALADKIGAETLKAENQMKTDKALKSLSENQFETERLARRSAIIKKVLLASGALGVDKVIKKYTGYGI